MGVVFVDYFRLIAVTRGGLAERQRWPSTFI
jgi:hypothetical protein